MKDRAKQHGTKFDRKREEAIHALCTHRSIEEAARAAGIGERTLHRWMKKPEFQDAFREARRTVFSQANARMQQASSAAVSTLLKVMIDPAAPPAARVRAADRILDGAYRATQMEDIECRLSALERSVESSA
jgi:hypothetical protein